MKNDSSSRKKMTTLYILEILKKYTDDTCDSSGRPVHCLTQAQIGEKLLSDYEIVLDRKAISRGINDLCDSREYGDKIVYDVETRKVKIGGEVEESEIRTNFRYCHDFDSAQIRLLMDAVLFSKNIPAKECEGLLRQISTLGDIDARNRLANHLYNLNLISGCKVSNDQILYNIGVIDEAIDKGRQISFIYNDYGKDKALHPRLRDGVPVVRVVNPYSMVANNGRFYLLCNYDKYDNATIVRIDKITDIETLDTPVKSKKKVKGLSTPETQAEQLYMQPGSPEWVEFKVNNDNAIISNVVDWFGNSVKFSDQDDGTVMCRAKVNPNAMLFWAMQYSDYVEVVEPASLRNEIRNTLSRAWEKYNK